MKRKLEDSLDNEESAKRPRGILPDELNVEPAPDRDLFKTLDLPPELQEKVFENVLDKPLARKLVSALSHLDSSSAERSAPYSLHAYVIGIEKLDALSEKIFHQVVFRHDVERNPDSDQNGVTLPSGRLQSVAGLLPLQSEPTKTRLVNDIVENEDDFEQFETLQVALEHLEHFNCGDRDRLVDLTIHHLKSADGPMSHAGTIAIEALIRAEDKFSATQRELLKTMLNEDPALKDAYSQKKNSYVAEIKSIQSPNTEAITPQRRPMSEECDIILDTADVIARQPMPTQADIVLNAKFVAAEIERILIPQPVAQRLRSAERTLTPSSDANRCALMKSERRRSYNER